MKVFVCLCYLNIREVAITAPRSKRQTEKDPGEPGHSRPRMSTEVHTSQRCLRARPSRRSREGLAGAPTAKGWEWDHRRRAADPIRGRTLILSQGSSKLQTWAHTHTHTHTRHSNGTQRHTKTHVHTPWQCTKSRYYLNCWATGNCSDVILLQFPHKVNFLTRAILQK